MVDILAQVELNFDIGKEVNFDLETSDEFPNNSNQTLETSDHREVDTEEIELPTVDAQEEVAEETQSPPEACCENDQIFENCVRLLKQLFHTFVRSHLFDFDVCGEDQMKAAFEGLFAYKNW